MTVQLVETQAGFSYLQCACDRSAIRLRTQANGVRIYSLQCLECGRQIRAVSKNAPEVIEMPNVLPFDEGLKERWERRRRAHSEIQMKTRERERQEQNEEWRERYRAYLLTTEWRLKRQKVLARANNWCEGCGQRQAAEVHHTTYKHVFNEFLFELVAVCESCHRRIHSEDEQ